MSPRKPITIDTLTAAQKRALTKAINANKKLTDHQAKEETLVKARNEAIKSALGEGVTQLLVAEALAITPGMVWKIKENKTTQQLARLQRERDGKTSPSWIGARDKAKERKKP